MSTYFVGTIFKPRDDWQNIAVEPQAPSNYRDPAKIAAFVENAREEQRGDVAVAAITGKLHSVCVLDEDQEPVYRSNDGDKNVGAAFAGWLANKFPLHFADALRNADAFPNDVIIGFAVKRALKVAAFEALMNNVRLPVGAKVRVPVRLWHNPVGVYDPEDLLMSSQEKKAVNWRIMAYELGVSIPMEFGSDARVNAFVCSDLAKECQLVPIHLGATVQ
jgi:hypothetical protein